MKLHRSPPPHPALLFLAPALMLLLVLVFFLLLTSSFLVQPGVAVSVPASPFSLLPQKNPRIITVTASPQPAIYFENAKVSLEELRGRLRELRGRGQTIIIKADRRANYETLSEVMNMAIALDFPVVLAGASGPW